MAAQEQAKAKEEKAVLEAQLGVTQQQLEAVRKLARWGDGVDFPEKSGSRDFLGQGFVPTKGVRDAIALFGHTASRLDALVEKGGVLARQLEQLDPPMKVRFARMGGCACVGGDPELS